MKFLLPIDTYCKFSSIYIKTQTHTHTHTHIYIFSFYIHIYAHISVYISRVSQKVVYKYRVSRNENSDR